MIKRLKRLSTPLCFLPNGQLVCYSHGRIFVYDNGSIKRKINLKLNFLHVLLSYSRLLSRALRLGIRASCPIDNENVLLSIGCSIYELNLINGSLSQGFHTDDKSRPLQFSNLQGIQGFDDGVYFGSYLVNPNKKPVGIYRREGVDNWNKVFEFCQNEINHVHAIVPDGYHSCVWIFTGDLDHSAAIWRASDSFKRVERIVSGNQLYRGCVAFPTETGLIYATDSPYSDNYICILREKECTPQVIAPISGSCIYGCMWKSNMVFSTSVEGDGRNQSIFTKLFGTRRGAGIKDEYMHMYLVSKDLSVKEIYKERKDKYSFYLFQFGAFIFPYGDNHGDSIVFQQIASKKNDMRMMVVSDVFDK